MIRLTHLVTAILAVALCGVALESELPQRVAARLGLWPEALRPSRSVDVVAAELEQIYPTKHADIVMLGDSLTAEAEWQELLSDRDVVNRGVAGQTVPELLARAEGVHRLNPRVVFVMAGINDLTAGKAPDVIAEDYAALLDRLADGPGTVVVQSVVHVAKDRNALGLQRFWYNRRNDMISALNDRLRAMAAERGLRFVDLNTKLAPTGVLADDLTIDGTHLRGAAYLLWVQELERALDDIDAANGTTRPAAQTATGRS